MEKEPAIGGKPPLGYDGDKDKQYIINKKAAEAVKFIFNKTLEEWPIKKIAEHLNEKGYRTKKEKEFSIHSFDLLRNRKYIGEYVFNVNKIKKESGKRKAEPNIEDDIIRIPDGMPQIIDEETFNRVQYILNKRSKGAQLRFKPSKYMLTGLLKCGECNSNMYGNTSYNGKTGTTWISYTHQNYRKSKCRVIDITTHY